MQHQPFLLAWASSRFKNKSSISKELKKKKERGWWVIVIVIVLTTRTWMRAPRMKKLSVRPRWRFEPQLLRWVILALLPSVFSRPVTDASAHLWRFRPDDSGTDTSEDRTVPLSVFYVISESSVQQLQCSRWPNALLRLPLACGLNCSCPQCQVGPLIFIFSSFWIPFEPRTPVTGANERNICTFMDGFM